MSQSTSETNLESLQSTTIVKKDKSLSRKEQRKKDRRLARRTNRIAENRSIAMTVQLIFSRYDVDENGHLDKTELKCMILDLQRQVEDHVKVTDESATDAANLLLDALDRDNNNEVELAELQDWIIRKSDKLDENTRRRIMAMHEAGDDSETVERQVVLVRLLTAVEDVSEHIEKGCVVAVFGHGKLGLAITSSGAITETFVPPTPTQAARAACLTSGDITAGMEIIQVGFSKENLSAEQIIHVLQTAPRPIQMIFQNAADHKHEAARKLQRIRSSKKEIDVAKLHAQELRVKRAADQYFSKYDLDNNETLDADELQQMLLDIIVSWSGVNENEDDGDTDNISEIDMDKETKLAYHGAHMLVKEEGTPDGTNEQMTHCTINDGPLGMKIACIDLLNENESEKVNDNDPHNTEVHITEVTPNSQADTNRIKVGYIVKSVGGHNVGGKEYIEVVNMFKTLPRPFDLQLLRGINPVLTKKQFAEWIWKTSNSWKNPTPKMTNLRQKHPVHSFLIEIANAVANTAEIQRGGRQIVVLFRSPAGVDLGLDLSNDGRVLRCEKEALDLGIECGMILMKVGQKDIAAQNNVQEYFVQLCETAHRPLRAVFRRKTAEENNAALKMQSIHRGRSTRKNLKQEQEKENAAIIVQSHVRRKSSMKVVDEKVRIKNQGQLVETMVELVIIHTEGGIVSTNSKNINPRYRRTLEQRIECLKNILSKWIEWTNNNVNDRIVTTTTAGMFQKGGPPLFEYSLAIQQVAPIWGKDNGSLFVQLNQAMIQSDPVYTVCHRNIFRIQRWIKNYLIIKKFQRVVEDAAAIKITKLLERNKNYKNGQKILNTKRSDNELEQIQRASNAARVRNESRENSRKTRSSEMERLAMKKKEREERRRGRQRRNQQQNGSSFNCNNSTSVLPSINSHSSRLPSPSSSLSSSSSSLPITTMNDLFNQLLPTSQNALRSLINSKLFLKPSVHDLLPILEVAPAHQQAVIRWVVQMAGNGDTSSLEDLILDAVDEATEAPTMAAAPAHAVWMEGGGGGGGGYGYGNGYHQWGSGASYNMNARPMMQMVPHGGGMMQSHGGGPPVQFVMMQPPPMQNQPMMMGSNGMMQSHHQMQPQSQQLLQLQQFNSPRMKHLRPGTDLLNNMDPSKFSGVVVFEKGKPVEAHVDEPGQKPVWDELWSTFNTKHGV